MKLRDDLFSNTWHILTQGPKAGIGAVSADARRGHAYEARASIL